MWQLKVHVAAFFNTIVLLVLQFPEFCKMVRFFKYLRVTRLCYKYLQTLCEKMRWILSNYAELLVDFPQSFKAIRG